MRTAIEPGLLRVFRWFVGVRLAWLVLVNLTGSGQDGGLLFVPQPGIVVYGLLLIYLLAAPTRPPRWYLPLALAAATISPIIENGVTIAHRLSNGSSPNEALSDYWLLFVVLAVPLILTAWQYRYRWVVVFTAGTLVMELLATLAPLDGTNADFTLVGALMVARAGLFLVVGLVISKLVAALRAQRTILAETAADRERLAASEERARLARELHDTLAHTLSAVAVQLEGARSVLDDDPDRARAMLDRTLTSTRSGLADARRSIQALRAGPVEELGLVGAIEAQATSLSANGFAAVVDADPLPPVTPGTEHALYRIAGEALTNAARHSGGGHAVVSLRHRGDRLVLSVKDDGKGIDPETADGSPTHGLRGMRERAEQIGGTLLVRTDPGGGTVVTCAVPL